LGLDDDSPASPASGRSNEPDSGRSLDDESSPEPDLRGGAVGAVAGAAAETWLPTVGTLTPPPVMPPANDVLDLCLNPSSAPNTAYLPPLCANSSK
jgi:hypothetical protein